MNIALIAGIIVAVIGVIILALVIQRKAKLKRVLKTRHWEEKEENENRRLRIWSYRFGIITFLGVIIALLAWFFPFRAKLEKETEQRISRIEKETKEANENIKAIEKHLGVPIYVDGLPQADPPVFDPFAKGSKLMAEYKWDEAIAEFKKSMKEAKASQLVALYNLIGLCYYTPGKLDLTLENWNKSLSLAKEFNDKVGEAKALGNIGLVYQTRGDLDKALKYHEDAKQIAGEIGEKGIEARQLEAIALVKIIQGELDVSLKLQNQAIDIHRKVGDRVGEARCLGNIGVICQTKGELEKALKNFEEALKIDREIGNREYEAKTLSNIGVIYQVRGDLDNALKYFEDALEINRDISSKEGEAQDLGNIGLIFGVKGEKEKALKYCEDALRLFTEIGTQKDIEIAKRNIKRLKGE